MGAPPGPTTVVLKRIIRATDDEKAFPMSARNYLVKRATELRQGADKNLQLAQRRYRKDYDRRVCLAIIFRVGGYVFLDTAPLFYLAAERSASKGYHKLLPRK